MGNASWKTAFIFWMRAYFLPEKRPSEEIAVKCSMDEQKQKRERKSLYFHLAGKKRICYDYLQNHNVY